MFHENKQFLVQPFQNIGNTRNLSITSSAKSKVICLKPLKPFQNFSSWSPYCKKLQDQSTGQVEKYFFWKIISLFIKKPYFSGFIKSQF